MRCIGAPRDPRGTSPSRWFPGVGPSLPEIQMSNKHLEAIDNYAMGLVYWSIFYEFTKSTKFRETKKIWLQDKDEAVVNRLDVSKIVKNPILDSIETPSLHSHCESCYNSLCEKETEFLSGEKVSCPTVSCKFCNVRMHECKFEDHLLICRNFRRPCLNSINGCPYLTSNSEQTAHLRNICPVMPKAYGVSLAVVRLFPYDMDGQPWIHVDKKFKKSSWTTFNCKFCKVEIWEYELEDHLLICSNFKKPCLNSIHGCPHLVSNSEMTAHLRNICPAMPTTKNCSMVICKFCKVEIPKYKMEDHLVVCQNIRKPCLNSIHGCPHSVRRFEQTEHLLNGCPAMPKLWPNRKPTEDAEIFLSELKNWTDYRFEQLKQKEKKSKTKKKKSKTKKKKTSGGNDSSDM